MNNERTISQSIYNFQSALIQDGNTLESYLKTVYSNKWISDSTHHVLAIRTTFVNSMHNYLHNKGLYNMERVSLSPVTDPLAHDIEHVPTISYKGHDYRGTHSMIYPKFLACFNKKIKGIYVDSPNIRLELESSDGAQRGKYLIDFSQMDIELKRNRNISIEEYLNNVENVKKVLNEDMEEAMSFFEELLVTSVREIKNRNEDDLKALGVDLEEPKIPFPRFKKDELIKKYGNKDIERKCGKEAGTQFFWIVGLIRENYDLIYPYLNKDGSKINLNDVTSDMVYNYDICAQALQRDTNTFGDAYEISSGAIREWLFEPIVERLVDNKIINTRPEIKNGNIENVDELDGYGPFLMATSLKDEDGKQMFPDTFGGGIGIERTLFALCKGDVIKKIDDITLFGKNPDSHPIYLF